jgi:hypothetical protein
MIGRLLSVDHADRLVRIRGDSSQLIDDIDRLLSGGLKGQASENQRRF